MIRIYCRKKHGGKSLCQRCAELESYARQRSDKCPFMENKTFCSNCRVHCYKPEIAVVWVCHVIYFVFGVKTIRADDAAEK